MNNAQGIHESSSNGSTPTPSLIPVFPYIQGYEMEYYDSTNLIINEGWTIDDTLQYKITNPLQLNLNLATIGLGGIDIGLTAIDTWYYAFAIYNPTTDTTNVIFSLDSLEPTFPIDYTKSRRIGVFRTDPLLINVLKFYQFGSNLHRKYLWDIDSANRAVVTGDLALIYTTVDCSSLIPPITKLGIFFIFHQLKIDGWIRPSDSTIDYFVSVGNNMSLETECATNDSQSIEFINNVAGGSMNIYVNGFEDNLTIAFPPIPPTSGIGWMTIGSTFIVT